VAAHTIKRSTELIRFRSSSTALARAGLSVMMQSAPRPIMMDIITGSFTVQTWTFLPRLCAERMKLRVASFELTARKSASSSDRSPSATAVSRPTVHAGRSAFTFRAASCLSDMTTMSEAMPCASTTSTTPSSSRRSWP